MKKLLLISNSISKNGEYLNHCFYAIKKIIGKRKKIVYIPYALANWNKCEDFVRQRFTKANLNIRSIHHDRDQKKSIMGAEVVFVGGGNTFRLLKRLQDLDLLEVIKTQVKKGKLVYIGASAGSNLACPTIMTTNDMPIDEVKNLNALSLVPFQINPHYIDPERDQKHRMETRDERINQFHEENNTPVIGLREGSFLLLEKGNLTLSGDTGARLFEKGKKSRDLQQKQLLNFLL